MAEVAGAPTGEGCVVPEEHAAVRQRETYENLVRRLSHQSVVKHFDAYADIAWDSPEYAIWPDAPCWELGPDEGLGSTAWYRAQPPEVRSRIGLHAMAHFTKVGVQFESTLKRGLLEFASRLPTRSPEFRYVYHELIEEAQHALMFQEFVNRTGIDMPGPPAWERSVQRVVIRFARTFPELFFFFVLAGEDPIDHMQRDMLRRVPPHHPLFKRIIQIHVTEEARHLCFARHYLKRTVAELGPFKRFILSMSSPIVIGAMAARMMEPSTSMIRTYGIPKAVIREAYTRDPRRREKMIESVRKVRELCEELGLVTRLSKLVWRALGIWGPAASPAA